MSKASKKRTKELRRAEKKARKLANYIRFGPKGPTKKAKKKKIVGTKSPTVSPPTPQSKTSAAGRRRRRKNGANLRVGGKRK